MADRRTFMRLAFLSALMLPAASVLVACDPCFGVVGCRSASHVAAQGKIVDVVSGESVKDVRVSLVRVGSADDSTLGSQIADSTSAVTDDDGNFQVELDGGAGTFDVVVAPPNTAPYRVRNLPLESSERRGGGNALGVWVNTPVFDTAAELYLRATNQRLSGGTVTFERTGGVAISGGEVQTTAIDGAGRAALLAGDVAGGADDVIGTLTVDAPAPYGQSVISNFHFAPNHVFRSASVQVIGVGPTLSWRLQVYDRASGQPVPGTTVTFSRTGGIATTADSFTTVTDTGGYFLVPLQPLAQGTVVGDLTLEPPAPYHTYVESSIQIPTLDADTVGVLRRYGVGLFLPWLGTVTCDGSPLTNARVVVVHVGGAFSVRNELDTHSDSAGQFDFSAFWPTEAGTMVFDLRFTPARGSGCSDLEVSGFRVPTVDRDTTKQSIATWDLPRP